MSGTWVFEYLNKIEVCEENEDQLNDWERGFIDSLRVQIEKGFRPSDKQTSILDRVHEKIAPQPRGYTNQG
jgi:hypothetical protein